MTKHLHGRPFQVGLGLVMAYEFAAFFSGGRVPPITRISKRTKHVVGGVVVGVLAIHFITTPEEAPHESATTL